MATVINHLALLAALTSMFNPTARAALSVLDDSSALNPTSVKSAPPSCDDLCGKLVGSQVTGHTGGVLDPNQNGIDPSNPTAIPTNAIDTNSVGPQGGAGWHSPDDDRYCANHGFPTDATVIPTATPTPLTTASTCNIPTIGGESCAAANTGILRCIFRNSQVIQYCLAYEAGSQATVLNEVVLALDVVATAACANACFGAALTLGQSQWACSIAGGAASLGEITAMLEQDSSPVGASLQGFMAAAGAAGAVTTSAVGTASQTAIQLAHNQAEKVAALNNSDITGENGSASLDSAVQNAKDAQGAQNNNTVKDKSACVSAAIFAIMSGVRTYDVTQQTSAKDSACQQVQTLYGNAMAAGTTGGGTTPNPSQFAYNPQSNTLTQGGPSGSGGGTGNNNLLNPTANALQQCAATNTCVLTSSPNSIAATDSGLLGNGAGQSLAPLASQLAQAGLMKDLSHGAGALVSGAMGGSAGDMGAALSQLAQQAQDHATELPGIHGAVTAYGGGGGRSGGTSSEAVNPFGNLFAPLNKDGGARAPAAEQFGKENKTDIWHTGSTENIFQIVSGKIEKIVTRVVSK